MKIFADLHIVHAHIDGIVGHFFQFAAAKSGQANGYAAIFFSIFNRFLNIFGIAAAGNPDDIIAGLE